MILRYGCGYGYGYGYSELMLLSVLFFCGLFGTGYSICHPKGQCDAIVAETIYNVQHSFPQYNAVTHCFRKLVNRRFNKHRQCVHGSEIMGALITCVKRRNIGRTARQIKISVHEVVRKAVPVPVRVHAGLTDVVRQGGPEGGKGDKRICKASSPCCTFRSLDSDVSAEGCLKQNCFYWYHYLKQC